MRAGQLRHKITIQYEVETADGLGGFSLTWSDKFDVRAAIWPISAKENLASAKLELEVTHRIRIRYRSGITAKNRIKFGSRTFNIVSLINQEERNIMLDILTIEVT